MTTPGRENRDRTERLPEAQTERLPESRAELQAMAEAQLAELDSRKSSAGQETAKLLADVKRQFPDVPAALISEAEEAIELNDEDIIEVIEDARAEVKKLVEAAAAAEGEPRPDVQKQVDSGASEILDAYQALTDNLKRDPAVLQELYQNQHERLARELPDLRPAELAQLKKALGETLARMTVTLDSADRGPLLEQIMREQSPAVALEALRTADLDDKQREAVLLKAAETIHGDELIRDFPELFAQVDRTKVLMALAEYHPLEAMKEAAAGQGGERLAPVEKALETYPELAEQLDSLGFSPQEKYALAVRLANNDPGTFFEVYGSTKIDLTAEEQSALAQDMLERDPASFGKAIDVFKMSSDQAVEIMSQYPPNARERLLREANVPADKAEEMAKAMAELKLKGPESGSEQEKYEQMIERAQAAERSVLLAVERAFPDRIERERERARSEQELMEPISKIGDLKAGSANSPMIVTFEGRTMPACYKPHTREYGYPPSDEDTSSDDHEYPDWLRNGIVPGDSPMREWLSYQIDKVFKLDLVPPTVVRDGPDGFGSNQDWRVGRVAADVDGGQWESKAKTADLMKLAFLDALIENTDRHSGNFLISPDGSVHAIDNGSSFSERPDKDGLRSHPMDLFKGRPIPPELGDRIKDFRESPELQKALHGAFDAAFGKKRSAKMWNRFVQRVEFLGPSKKDQQGVFPAPTWH